MSPTFEVRLGLIAKGPVTIDDDAGHEHGPEEASIRITWTDGTKLLAIFWRLISGGKASCSSFDHRQTYGRGAPLDARALLRKELSGHSCTGVRLDRVTGDLVLDFADGRALQIFNFTGYEIWAVRFPDGSEEYSNYVLKRG
jgi:hypothetical protein